jgi:uncharacterized membrane protein YeiH
VTAHFPLWLEWIGVAVFALSGALTAARKGMDPFGFAFLAAVTGIGGGTLRDLLLGRAVSWVVDPTNPAICVCVGLAAFVIGARFQPTNASFTRVLIWADAGGLAIFAVSGAQTALLAGAHPVTAVVLGTLSATFGGIARDVLAGDPPLVLHREIYVTAAALGATVYVGAFYLGYPAMIGALAGVAAGFSLRALAILRDWSLPAFPGGTSKGG